MKIKFALIFVLGIAVGYITGCILPTKYLQPSVANNDLNLSDLYGLVIQFVAAIATLLAVVVALFREEIRRYWDYVDIEYSIPEDKFLEVLNSNIGGPNIGTKQPLEAEKYLCLLELSNQGTITSHSTEIILESVKLKNSNSKTPRTLASDGLALFWDQNKEQRVSIPPNGRRKIVIFELISPEKESSPEGNESTTSPQLNFSGVEESSNFRNGLWQATYLVYSSNCKPKRFRIDVSWNGTWHGRKTEMQNCLDISLNLLK